MLFFSFVVLFLLLLFSDKWHHSPLSLSDSSASDSGSSSSSYDRKNSKNKSKKDKGAVWQKKYATYHMKMFHSHNYIAVKMKILVVVQPYIFSLESAKNWINPTFVFIFSK